MSISSMLNVLKGCKAEIAIFGGSGLHDLIDLKNKKTISYKDVGFKYVEIEGHNREFIFGTFNGKKIVQVSRFHLYESGSNENILILFEILNKLGVKIVITTTATGAINPNYKAGEVMLIKDHINLSGTTPLVGHSPLKFINMTDAYDISFRKKVKQIAKKHKIKIHEGVHIQVPGPAYESPAEIRAYRNLGADSVSMSNAYATILARYFDMKCLSFASITNKAATYNGKKISHEEVLEISKIVCHKLKIIIHEFIKSL